MLGHGGHVHDVPGREGLGRGEVVRLGVDAQAQLLAHAAKQRQRTGKALLPRRPREGVVVAEAAPNVRHDELPELLLAVLQRRGRRHGLLRLRREKGPRLVASPALALLRRLTTQPRAIMLLSVND
jgi:hypothetical protein